MRSIFVQNINFEFSVLLHRFYGDMVGVIIVLIIIVRIIVRG